MDGFTSEVFGVRQFTFSFSGVFVVTWPMTCILSAVFRDLIVYGYSDLSVSRSNILSFLWSVWG